MSIPFNEFPGGVRLQNIAVANNVGNYTIQGVIPAQVATVADSRSVIYFGLSGIPGVSFNLNPNNLWNIQILNGRPPAVTSLANNLSEIVRRWWADNEAERRLIIDTFLRKVLRRADHEDVGVYLEENLRETGGRNGFLEAGTQVGRGRLDYLISSTTGIPPQLALDNNNAIHPGLAALGDLPGASSWVNHGRPNGPDYRLTVVVEAKDSIVDANAQPLLAPRAQLLAQLATVRQIMPLGIGFKYSRGILTDGRYWLFCQLRSEPPPPLPQAQAVPPFVQWTQVYNAANQVQAEVIMRIIRRFALTYSGIPVI